MGTFEGNGFHFELGERTYIMGILNITPDSFSDGGKWNNPAAAFERALEMQKEGADIIDIGAQSTRPGHSPMTAEQEIERLKPVLEVLKNRLEIPISVDTYYSKVAEFALCNGAVIINDVSGDFNIAMAEVIKKYHAGWIIMHDGGGNADSNMDYQGDASGCIRKFFEQMLLQAETFGIPKTSICVDPGYGFGKSYEDNIELLKNTRCLKIDGVALLTAVSRKRVTGQPTGVLNPEERLFATIAANTAAIAGGTDLIRVHDVKECLQAAKMADAIYRN